MGKLGFRKKNGMTHSESMTSGSLWENVGFLNSSLIPVLMHSGSHLGICTQETTDTFYMSHKFLLTLSGVWSSAC